MEHQPAAAGAGVDLLLHAHQADAHLIEPAAEQDQVVQRTAEPVEPPHRQHVAGPRHLQRHGQSGAGRLGAAHPVLVHLLAASQVQGIALQVQVLVVGRDQRVADQHAAPCRSGNPSRVNDLGRRYPYRVYACYPGLPSRFGCALPVGSKPVASWPAPAGHLPTQPCNQRGRTPMIAIPVAAFMRPVAVIVGQSPQTRCSDLGHGRPMIAIPDADDCRSLYLPKPSTSPCLPARPSLPAFPISARTVCCHTAPRSRQREGRHAEALGNMQPVPDQRGPQHVGRNTGDRDRLPG